MNPEDKYLEVNKESWNQRVDTHFDSEFYDVEGFLKGNTSLNSIELDLLGDITGKSTTPSMPLRTGQYFSFTDGWRGYRN